MYAFLKNPNLPFLKIHNFRMATVNFYLESPNNKKMEKHSIFMYFRYKGKTLKYSTGEKVKPQSWDANKQRVKKSKDFINSPEFNAHLNDLAKTIQEIYVSYTRKGTIPTTKQLKADLKQVFKKEATEAPPVVTLYQFIEQFIEESKGNKGKSAIGDYRTTLKHLREFEKLDKYSIHFDSIDLKFYQLFKKYLIGDLGLHNNTFGKYIKNIKLFMGEAVQRKLTTNLTFQHRKFKVLKEVGETIYLDENELSKLYNLDLSQNKRLERVRDLFIIGCYTGLRFSDFSQISPHNIKEDEHGKRIEIVTQKTNENVSIPLKPLVEQILNKYGGRIPRSISNQKMNKYLKELGKMAGFDQKIEQTTTKGAKREKKFIEKYELITTHTARRSFATNAYLGDLPIIGIMQITGHKTETAFMRYIKITKKENAKKMAKYDFFK